MTYIIIFLLSVVCAVLYRLGGASPEAQDREFPWIPRWFKNLPKKRDVGCSLVTMLALFVAGLRGEWWMWLILFGAQWGALSTYYDDVFFNPISPDDNHWMHGFFIGLSTIAFYHTWQLTFIRAFACALLMGSWSRAVGKDTLEEKGRGFIMCASTVIVLLI